MHRVSPFKVTLAPHGHHIALSEPEHSLCPFTCQPVFSPFSEPIHLQLELVLSLVWALLKFRSLVMTVDQSLPLSGSLCPHLRGEVLGPDRPEGLHRSKVAISQVSLCLALLAIRRGCVFVLVLAARLAGPYFPNQGSNPGPQQ